MTDEKLTEFIIEIKASLASIDTKVDGVLETLKNHEIRITNIERADKKDDFKVEILKFLGKGLVIALLIIASLTGSAGLIKGFFNV